MRARPSGTRLALVVLADAAAWAGLSVLVGWVAQRLPAPLVEQDGRLTRLRPWERHGAVYERLGVRRWKDRLPEAGAALRGGVAKRTLPGRGTEELRRFAAETRRAELVHWALPVATPLFALWNPPAVLAGQAVYAVAANAPCLVVQRYNRGRVQRILDARSTSAEAA